MRARWSGRRPLDRGCRGVATSAAALVTASATRAAALAVALAWAAMSAATVSATSVDARRASPGPPLRKVWRAMASRAVTAAVATSIALLTASDSTDAAARAASSAVVEAAVTASAADV